VLSRPVYNSFNFSEREELAMNCNEVVAVSNEVHATAELLSEIVRDLVIAIDQAEVRLTEHFIEIRDRLNHRLQRVEERFQPIAELDCA
jgi:hypothetical protein